MSGKRPSRHAFSRLRLLVPLVAVLSLLVNGVVSMQSVSATTSGDSARAVAREPQLLPDQLGNGVVDGLQYANPTEGLALMSPPVANSGGGAQVDYPFVIPPGRGITPEISLAYDSGGTNSWAGAGWDLSVGEISVDTSFGAPHFDPALESESYLLNGELLTPNANGDVWTPRVAERQDFTRQVETEFQQIIRHGDSPKTYFWEVRDKFGNIFWYGGKPDPGGPFGGREYADDEDGAAAEIDPRAIVFNDKGNAVKWHLSAQRDVGVNQIRYSYTPVTYVRTASGWNAAPCVASAVCGRHLYLDHIDYTEAAQVAPDPGWENDAPYRVQFQRQSVVTPQAAVRPDPIIDGSLGYLDVTNDRLARVVVMYGDPKTDEPRSARDYDQVAVRYDLEYEVGPFGKSLLSRVGQISATPAESAWHEFDYSDPLVRPASGGYTGFAAPVDWKTAGTNAAGDIPDQGLLGIGSAAVGALGASVNNTAEGHAYVGFNLAIPDKNGSFGVAFQIGGGGTEALAEWIDLNGDTLPDKVYRDGSAIKFRLNQSGPDGGDEFGDATPTGGSLPRLSRDASVGFQVAVEAHLVVNVGVGIGGDISIGDSYFTDVNADGLIDFVSAGSVYFNRLVDGIPTFATGSSGTLVPLPADGGAPSVTVDKVTELQTDLEAQSPPIDTVRRWTAPYSGTVSIDAPVTMEGVGSKDGVRVAIQHQDTELSSANLLATDSSAFSDAITRTVSAGQEVFFRVGSINDGANDEVAWTPEITYTAVTGVPDLDDVPLDANGSSQLVFDASDDFTLAGRPNSGVVMPKAGLLKFTATVTTTAKLSDDLRLVVEHNGVPVPATAGQSWTIASGTDPGTVELTADLNVAAPVVPTQADPDVTPSQDTVEAYLAADSPVDLTQVSFSPSAHYDGEPTTVVDFLPEVEQYPHQSPRTVASTVTADGTYDVSAAITNPSNATTAVMTVKTAAGVLVDKATAPVANGTSTVTFDSNTDFTGGTYFLEFMLRDDDASPSTALGAVTLHPDGETDHTKDVAGSGVLRWRGLQGIFPLTYRGWGVAGYTAAGPKATAAIDRSAFVVQEADFDAAEAPTGFEDIDTSNPGSNVEPSYAFIPAADVLAAPGTSTLPGPQWRGPRENHAVNATAMRTSRLGADSVALSSGPGVASGSGTAVTRVGMALPSASLAIGVGPFGGSFGIGPSFGLVDYEDLNGDGYPDVVTPGKVHYTNQRGGYLPSSTGVSDLAVINQDLTLSASGGLSVDLIDIKGSSKGKTNATKGGAAAKGGAANDSSSGVGIGGNVSASWTSPNASGGSTGTADPNATYADALGGVPADSTGGPAIQVALADVNGDALPDRVFTTGAGVFAQYNLGYGFTPQAVQLTTGGFQSQESYAGTASLGFKTPLAEFSGGFALNWNYDQSRYTWVDVNGDGILDQLRKVDGGRPKVAFGTGSGVLAPVEYGDVASSDTTLVPAGQQVSFDQANGAGGGADFTVYIGPLCLVACYLVINPGFSYQNSVSTTRIDMQDVNGDGFADSVSTGNDDTLTVRLNLQGTTNLLTTVTNPLGGSFTMGYGRDGNTVDHPSSTWTMTSVSTDDGRPGDGADVQEVEYEYAGLAYDRVHRQSLGFDTVVADEMDVRPDRDAVLRTTTTDYRNDSVFDAGLQEAVTVSTPTGQTLHRATTRWGFRDVRDVADDFDVLATVTPVDTEGLGATDTVGSRGRSVAPMVVRSEESWFEAGAQITSSSTTFTYDGLGNMLTRFDEGQPTDSSDDVLVTTDYADCLSAASDELGCASDAVPANVNTSPIYSDDLCPTWVSLPVEVTVTNGKTGDGKKTYRHRDGRRDVCDNASMTHHEETRDGEDVAATELTYDEWGSYDRIVYPAAADDLRYAVHYEWDDDGHGKIAQVTEYDLYDVPGNECDLETYIANAEDEDPANDTPKAGDVCDAVDVFLLDDPASLDDLTRFTPASSYPPFDLGDTRKGTSSSATFDPRNGRVASRTDANDNTIRYTYDSLGRTTTISSPRPQDTAPLVSFTYSPTAAGYASASARHLDVFGTGDTIDTYTFADGIGRTTQTKRDARLFTAAGAPPAVGRAVSGAVEYDALGRVVKEHLPTREVGVTAASFATAQGAVTAATTFDLRDRVTEVSKPGSAGNRVTGFAYSSAARDAGGPRYFTTKVTEPNQRATTSFFDVRGVTMAVDDRPAAYTAAQTVRTTFDYDGMGQMLRATDRAGNTTTHDYDQAGNRVATSTPDGGKVSWRYDGQGRLISKQTPNLRALEPAASIDYEYELGKLVAIDHPGSTPDVSYTYGRTGDANNGAGRVVRQEDGARIVETGYSEAGAMTSQLTEMKYHDWDKATDKSPFQTAMSWTYDGLGRIETMTYPDSEVLTYDYDEGGLTQTINGVEEGLIRVQTGIDPITLQPVFEDQPRTWTYEYLRDRQYDEMLRVRWQEVGNGARTERSFDPQTLWLSRQQSFSPGQAGPAPDSEIQDLHYAYDSVGNPTQQRNDLPKAVSNLMGGSSVHTYRYDPLERLTGGAGTYDLSDNRQQRYELTVGYDSNGNVTSKDQYDATVRTPFDPASVPVIGAVRPKTDLVNTKNTFTFDRTYETGEGSQPHQAVSAAGESYSYDRNGNLTSVRSAKGTVVRELQWDANDRMTKVTDGPSSTDYRYDDTGNRAIERGPAGETAFVNPWITTRNRNELFKHIWVDDDRLATQRDDGPYQELKRYFLHKDLQGSTNVVTDATGKVFQHHEYFPNGDVWIDEKSTQFRTPYQHAGAYIDEVRDLANMGARWYDQNRELFYSPDPALTSDPTALVRKPAMAAAYAYAGSNPVANIDPSGLEFFTVQSRASVVARHENARTYVGKNPAIAKAIVDSDLTSLPRSLLKLGLNIERADRIQKFSEALDPNPLVSVDLTSGTVEIGAPYGKRIRIPRNAPAAAGANAAAQQNGAAAQQTGTTAPVRPTAALPTSAADASGGPATGPGVAGPTAVTVAAADNAPPTAGNPQSARQRPPRAFQRSNSAPANLVSGSRADE